MKLLRYGPKGQEKPGMLDAGGRIRDLSGVVDDVDRHGVVRVIVGTIPLKLDAKHLEKT